MCLLHLIFTVIRIFCFITSQIWLMGYGKMGLIILYVDTCFLLILFLDSFLGTIRHIDSWQILLGIVKFYPIKGNKIRIIFFLAIQVLYLFIVASESSIRNYGSKECTLSWLYIHISHYFQVMLLFFSLQFLIIINKFYQKMYNILRDVHKKASYKNHEHRTRINFNIQIITEIRKKYLDYYDLIQHQTNIFGRPLLIMIILYIISFISEMRFLFFISSQHHPVYYITPVLEIGITTVSRFYSFIFSVRSNRVTFWE